MYDFSMIFCPEDSVEENVQNEWNIVLNPYVVKSDISIYQFFSINKEILDYPNTIYNSAILV